MGSPEVAALAVCHQVLAVMVVLALVEVLVQPPAVLAALVAAALTADHQVGLAALVAVEPATSMQMVDQYQAVLVEGMHMVCLL
ncbi:hypothetical protein [Thiomicrorhabdus cannonii]|uniref:hypothetical protein n=1 Tax=Thiomicrorhabdus cannonii TaxID=2748011 RepID=UPI0015BE7336|nr:hypothetical protein [Thiomicrorhabdus cannonii]